ncbi:MAG: DUF11 domain-containing protein, partial [Anaerolineae bacterium]|nr:DUF11 domain-containing protein [Anaerolineae bacterium]
PEFIRRATPNWTDVSGQPYQTYYADRRYGGPPDTQGHSGQACHPCNPLYGQRLNVDLNGNGILDPDERNDLNGDGRITPDEICDNTLDDIFDDQQPIRAEQEAAKTFLRRARANDDQVGFVAYSSSTNLGLLRELNCVNVAVALGEIIPDAPGLWDPVTGPDPAWIWGYDHRTSADGWSGPIQDRSTSRNLGSLVGAIEGMGELALTNQADGMRIGLEILDTEGSHYGRPAATSVMVLMTDGTANQYPRECPSGIDNLWPGDTPQDCVIYYANQARDSGVLIHTISLGTGADQALMQAVAERTGGVSYYAPSASDLDGIIDAIWQDLTETCFALSISKVTPAEVRLGDAYTVTIALSSTAAVSTTGVVVQDTIPTGTLFITASGAYVPPHPLPGETITWQIGEIPHDGTPVSVTVVLSVAQRLDAFVSEATVISSRGLTAAVKIGPERATMPHLLLSLSAIPDLVYAGQPFTYTIAVRNVGAGDALDVTAFDTMPAGTTFVSASGIYSPAHPLAGETMAWALGDLAIDGAPITVTLVLAATTPTKTIVLANTVEVSCTQGITASANALVTILDRSPPRWALYLPIVLNNARP